MIPIQAFRFECWIVGDPLTERFLVEIDNSKKVKDLRQAIKQERGDALGNVNAVNIMLWKVCGYLLRSPPCQPAQVAIPIKWDHWHEKNIRDVISQACPLAATEGLSSVYRYPTTPEYDHVHIIVWTGTLNLSCWIVGEETRRMFPVTINNSQDVADLQRVIKEKRLSAVSPNIDELDLTLWKVRSSAISMPSLLIGKGFDIHQG